MISSHQFIDARLLRLVQASVHKIDANPFLQRRLRENVRRWPDARLRERWEGLLKLPWLELRARLLAQTDEGSALRQEAPLGGILSPAERQRIMDRFAHDSRAA